MIAKQHGHTPQAFPAPSAILNQAATSYRGRAVVRGAGTQLVGGSAFMCKQHPLLHAGRKQRAVSTHASSAVMQQTWEHTATTAEARSHTSTKVIANPIGSTHEHACSVANALTHSTTATAHHLTSVYVYIQQGTVPQHGLPKGAMLTCRAGAATPDNTRNYSSRATPCTTHVECRPMQ